MTYQMALKAYAGYLLMTLSYFSVAHDVNTSECQQRLKANKRLGFSVKNEF